MQSATKDLFTREGRKIRITSAQNNERIEKTQVQMNFNWKQEFQKAKNRRSAAKQNMLHARDKRLSCNRALAQRQEAKISVK